MRALLVAAALAIAVAASALVDAAQSSSGKERRFFSARQGVGVEAPPGWTLSQHTGYPTVLVALVHPGGSRISRRRRSHDREGRQRARGAEQARTGGARPDRSNAWRPARTTACSWKHGLAGRGQALRQLYVVRKIEGGRDERQAVVVTLATPLADSAAASGPYDGSSRTSRSKPRFAPRAKPDAGR